jgi:hypothetical protein
MMWKQFTIQNHGRWVNLLPTLLDTYNHKIHSSIGISPSEASENPKSIKQIIMESNYENETNLHRKNLKFSVGDKVRIYAWRDLFDKHTAKEGWSNEIFVVSEVIHTNPVTYRIKDLKGEEIQGKFYESQLQLTKF